MAIPIKQLKNAKGNPIYPVTHQSCVLTPFGKTMDKLEQDRQDAEAKREEAEAERKTKEAERQEAESTRNTRFDDIEAYLRTVNANATEAKDKYETIKQKAENAYDMANSALFTAIPATRKTVTENVSKIDALTGRVDTMDEMAEGFSEAFVELTGRVDNLEQNGGGSSGGNPTLSIELPDAFLEEVDLYQLININEVLPLVAQQLDSNTLPHVRFYNNTYDFELVFDKKITAPSDDGIVRIIYTCLSLLENFVLYKDTDIGYWQLAPWAFADLETLSLLSVDLRTLEEKFNITRINGQELGQEIEVGVTPEQVSAIIAENSVVGTLGEAEAGGEETPSGQTLYEHNIKWYSGSTVKNVSNSSDTGVIEGASATIINNSPTPFTATTFKDYLRQNYARSSAYSYDYMNIVGYCTGTKPTIIGLMIDSDFDVLYYFYGAWQSKCYTSNASIFEGFRDTVVPVGSEEL